MQKTVVQRLKELQNSLNLTQIEFAEMVNISPSNLSGIYNGKRTCGETVITKIIKAIPGLSRSWLADGVGPMLKDNATTPVPVPPAPPTARLVPLLSLDVIAGFRGNDETSQYIEDFIRWEGSTEGDFAVHVNGASMQPIIPDGAHVLLCEAPFGNILDLEFGKVHAVCLEDRTLLKRILPDPDNPHHVKLVSYNSDYPPVSVPLSSIIRLFRAKSVRYNL